VRHRATSAGTSRCLFCLCLHSDSMSVALF
jgi:hypothetical protein